MPNNLIIIGAVTILVIMLSISNRTEGYKHVATNKFQFVQTGDTPPPPKHEHGYDTGCLPKLPRPLYSIYHDRYTAKKLQGLEMCGQCQDIERRIVPEVKNYLECLKNNGHFRAWDCLIPNIIQYRQLANCQACHLLVDTWSRYINNIVKILEFIRTGQLPTEPTIKAEHGCCQQTLDKCVDYARKVRTETECIINNQPCEKVHIPTHTYDSQDQCCEKIYNAWTLYTIDLIHIGDYVRCERELN